MSTPGNNSLVSRREFYYWLSVVFFLLWLSELDVFAREYTGGIELTPSVTRPFAIWVLFVLVCVAMQVLFAWRAMRERRSAQEQNPDAK